MDYSMLTEWEKAQLCTPEAAERIMAALETGDWDGYFALMDQTPNARRIYARWNKGEGMPTRSCGNRAGLGGFTGFNDMADAVYAQRRRVSAPGVV